MILLVLPCLTLTSHGRSSVGFSMCGIKSALGKFGIVEHFGLGVLGQYYYYCLTSRNNSLTNLAWLPVIWVESRSPF